MGMMVVLRSSSDGFLINGSLFSVLYHVTWKMLGQESLGKRGWNGMMMMVRFHVSSMRVCYVGMVDGCGISSNSSRFRLYFEVRFGHSDEVELSFYLW